MDLSNKIKAIREAKNIKQIDVAKALDLDPSYYFRLEKRGNKLTIEQLEQIGAVLGVSAVELMTGEPQKIEDTGRVKELENRVKELGNIIKDKEELISVRDKRFESIQSHLTRFLYEEIAKKAYEKGLSQKRFIDRQSGKLIKLLSYESEKEMIDSAKQAGKYSLFFGYRYISDEIARTHNVELRNIRWNYIVVPDYREMVSVDFFLNLPTYDQTYYPIIISIMESGIIEDKLLLFGYSEFREEEERCIIGSVDDPDVGMGESLSFQESLTLTKSRYQDFLSKKTQIPPRYSSDE